ncbi:MAG: hypothetical protein GY772_17835 [bacterium]|nr:hypothetical protein [bacterium]
MSHAYAYLQDRHNSSTDGQFAERSFYEVVFDDGQFLWVRSECRRGVRVRCGACACKAQTGQATGNPPVVARRSFGGWLLAVLARRLRARGVCAVRRGVGWWVGGGSGG